MKKRRLLADLYVTGKAVVLEDDKGTREEVWLQKLSPIEHEHALRAANAARARVLMVRNDPESEEWQATYAQVADSWGNRDEIIDYLISRDIREREQSIAEELGAEEEWSKDGYLQGLNDSWEGDQHTRGLKEEYARDPEHPEASRIFNEMKRFQTIVEEKLEPVRSSLRRDYERDSDETIRRKMIERLLETTADAEWLREISMMEMFYATRDIDDHTERYFDRRADLDLLSATVIGRLTLEYQNLVVDPMEGKGSAATRDSSPSSDPPAPEATVPSSGPLAVVQ